MQILPCHLKYRVSGNPIEPVNCSLSILLTQRVHGFNCSALRHANIHRMQIIRNLNPHFYRSRTLFANLHPPFYNGVWFKWRCGVLWPRAVLLCIHDLSHHRVMPPRKGIVKSGNAGNSSKSTVPSSSTPSSTTPGLDTPPPLFPPGSKYPLSLLNERWVKPHLETSPQQTRLVNSYPRIWQQLDVCAQCSWSKLTCRCQKEGWEKPVVDTVYVSLYWGYISLIIFLPATPRQWMVVCSEFKSTQ